MMTAGEFLQAYKITAKKITLTHPQLQELQADKKTSIKPVSQPKNILFWVPTGQALTAEQQKMVDDAGELNKKVGKGFFIRAYNLQNPEITPGTHFKIVYDMEIVNDSAVKNDKNDPLYFNSLSYYIQEIPNCPEGATSCTPIYAERSEMGDSNRGGELNINNPIFYSSYYANVSPYKPVNILKVDNKGEAVEDAEFTIYTLNDDGSQGTIAKNNMNQEMTNLVSNAEGKLVDKKTGDAVRVYLAKGKYRLVETVVPEGYVAESLSHDFEVVNGALELKIVNSKKETEKPTAGKPETTSSKPNHTIPSKPRQSSESVTSPKTGENRIVLFGISLLLVVLALLLLNRRFKLNIKDKSDI